MKEHNSEQHRDSELQSLFCTSKKSVKLQTWMICSLLTRLNIRTPVKKNKQDSAKFGILTFP